MPNTPTRFPKGVTNNAKVHPLGMLGIPSPTKYHTYFEDFDIYNATDFTITTTEAGSGSATEALADADGGVLVITNDDADNDNDWFQLTKETFKFATGKQIFFESRWKVSNVGDTDVVMGLQLRDTTPDNVTDGVYFRMRDGVSNLEWLVEKNDSSDYGGDAIVTADTYIVTAFYYDGIDSVEFWVDGALQETLGVTYLPDDEELTVSFGLQNGSANARNMSIDYIFVAKER